MYIYNNKTLFSSCGMNLVKTQTIGGKPNEKQHLGSWF